MNSSGGLQESNDVLLHGMLMALDTRTACSTHLISRRGVSEPPLLRPSLTSAPWYAVAPPPLPHPSPACPTHPLCVPQVLLILVSSGDKQADRAVVETVWDLLHEFDAMCRLLANLRSPCLPLAKASMQLLGKMHHSRRFSIGPRSILQVRH